MSKHTYTAAILIDVSDGGQHEIEAKIAYDFTPGTPERGRFGPVKNYDPGSPDDVFMTSVMITTALDTAEDAPPWLVALLESDETLRDAMALSASQDLDHAREAAMERRAEDRRRRTGRDAEAAMSPLRKTLIIIGSAGALWLLIYLGATL